MLNIILFSSEKKIKKTILLTIVSKKNKIIRNKFNQGGKSSAH